MKQVGQLRDAAKGLPGVLDASNAKYVEKISLERPPAVTMDLRLAAGDPKVVLDQIAQDSWKSGIFPLQEVVLTYVVEGNAHVEQTRYVFKIDSQKYTRLWGPRPS